MYLNTLSQYIIKGVLMKGHISLFNFFLLLVMFGVIFVILFSITSGSLMTGNAVHLSDKNIFPEDVVYKDPVQPNQTQSKI